MVPMVSKKKVIEKDKASKKKVVVKPSKSIPVLYEDKALLVLNKPSGLMVHGDGRSTKATLADYIASTYPKIKSVGESSIIELNGKKLTIKRPGIVHRLDQDTSGVIVVAKTSDSYYELKKLFKNREVKKVYRALVYGNLKQDTGIIDMPIGRSKKDFRARNVQDPFEEDARGTLRDAVTRYKVLARYHYHYKDDKGGSHDEPMTYVEIFPETGRTHQIRVHFKSIRHPLVGDSLYGPLGKPELVGRTALHAYSVSLKSPDTKAVIMVQAELPKDLQNALAKLTLV